MLLVTYSAQTSIPPPQRLICATPYSYILHPSDAKSYPAIYRRDTNRASSVAHANHGGVQSSMSRRWPCRWLRATAYHRAGCKGCSWSNHRATYYSPCTLLKQQVLLTYVQARRRRVPPLQGPICEWSGPRPRASWIDTPRRVETSSTCFAASRSERLRIVPGYLGQRRIRVTTE